MCVGMATKNISITEEAYKRLASLRRGNESFSEIIVKMVKKNDWRDYFGILSEEAGERLKKTIVEGRKIHARLHEERHKKLVKEFS